MALTHATQGAQVGLRARRDDARIAREISYATSASTRGGRVVIRALENATGRLRLIRMARGYESEVARGADFWEVIGERYGIRLEVAGGSLELIPAEGPLVVVANHPYGILDGLTMGRILSARRQGDFRVLAHKVFRRAPELDRVILPIDFDATPQAAETNLATRAEALRYLGAGGAIGVFPGGTVSTAATPFDRPMDPVWRSFTAKLIARSDATVVPIFFEGHNSRLFQIASHLHSTLRLGLLIREFRARVGTPVRVRLGEPIVAAELRPLRGDPRALMERLRRATYSLSPEPLAWERLGHEFEARYRAAARPAAARGI
jgi:putative hemolysin